MDESRRYFKLGLFVLITLALLVSFVVALGADVFSRVETVPFETFFNESVAGLDPGAPVKYRGLTIGKVTDVTLADVKYPAALTAKTHEPQPILVEMALDPRKFAPVTMDEFRRLLSGMIDRGMRARLSRALIGDVTVIEIDYVNPDLFPPPTLSWKPTELYIPSAPSTAHELVGGVERLVAKLNTADIPGLCHRADKLIVDLDQGVADLQLTTVREKALALVDEVRGTNRRLSDLLGSPDLKHAIADLPQITGKLKSSSARIDALLHGKRFEQILTGLASASSNAAPAAADARRLLEKLRDLVADEQDDIQVIVNNLRDMTDDGRGILDDVKQNPSRLIFGSPPPHIDPREPQ